MKKLLFIALALFFISSASFAQYLQKYEGTTNNTLTAVKVHTAPLNSNKGQTTVLTYADSINYNLGTGGTFNTNAFAYFPATAFTSHVGETIFKITVGVGSATDISSFELCIWTDTTGHGATTVMSQTIPVSNLVDGWNEILLSTPYTLSTSNIFVGYRMTTSGYSISCDATPDASGNGDMLQDPTDGTITHLGAINFGDLSIIAHVGTLDSTEAGLASIDNDDYILASASSAVGITGTIINNGLNDITSYDVTYSINNGTPVATYTVTPTTPISTGNTDVFTHNVTADFSTVGAYNVHVAISNINGDTMDANPSNDTLNKTINSLSQLIQKKVLHEVLTSSTCAPCAMTNPVIDGVVYDTNETKATLIKYQVSWPAPGDPYHNQESADRVTYYGTTGVPDFKVDGNNTEIGSAYTQAKLDAYASNPAIATIAGTATLTGSSVNVNIDYNAIADITGSLVAQVAVVEKKTVLNVGNNGETEFHNVMMKFIPSTSGTSLTNFTAPYTAQNVTATQNLSGTNVEWLGNLRVVAWLQDNATKEVYQSEYIDITSTVADAGVTDISTVASGCGLPSSNDVTFTVYNGGYTDLTDIVVTYTIGGGASQTATITGTTPAGSYGTVTVQNLDFSAVGNYDIVASTSVPNDGLSSNDSKTLVLNNIAPQTIPYAEPINDQTIGWSVEDANNDGHTWQYVTYNGFGHGDNTAYKSEYNSNMPADDYLYSTCINLNAGTTYDLNFWYKIGNGYPEKLKVLVGTSPIKAAMTQTIVDLGQISNSTYSQSSTAFQVSNSGAYYIGFYSYSDADMWYTAVDDISITDATGINSPEEQKYNIYPNPSTGIIVIEGAENSQITVYNMVGEIVYSEDNISNLATIDLSNYNSGNYMVRVVNDNDVTFHKIILSK